METFLKKLNFTWPIKILVNNMLALKVSEVICQQYVIKIGATITLAALNRKLCLCQKFNFNVLDDVFVAIE